MKLDPVHIDIKKFLPHRPPMLMVDRIEHIDAESVSVTFTVRSEGVFAQEGFLMEPGLIEHAAQACSAIVGQDFFAPDDLEGTGNKVVGYISTIKTLYIKALPKVGDTLLTKAKLVSRFDMGGATLCTIAGHTFRNDDLIVDCTLNFLISEIR